MIGDGASRVEYRLLGPVEVWAGGRRIDAGRPRQRAVLAALLVDAGRVVPVETLIARVWGQTTSEHARATLRTHMSRIRRLLEQVGECGVPTGVLSRASGGYLLQVDPDQVDLQLFRRLTDTASRTGGTDNPLESLRAALALWRGQPLAGIDGEWAGRMRETWGREHVAAAVAWARAELAQGNHRPVLAMLPDLASDNPLVEQLTEVLMRALHAAGRTSEALDRYTRTRVRLAEELGTDPGSELQALHRALLRGEVETAPPAASPAVSPRQVPRQLPARPQLFAGRAAELAALGKIHDASTVVITAIDGMAGVGKTTLAVHWAHRVTGRFPDGQLYVNLRGFDPGGPAATPAEVVRSFLDALDVPAQRVPAGLDAQTALYRSLLAERRMLVLLDNARDAEQVRPLLPGAPGCLVLVTSRNQLTGLVVGAGAVPLPLDVLSPDEARDLLAQRLGTDRVAAEPAAIEEIIERCARLPLALAVVAARAVAQRGLSLAALAAELANPSDRLDSLATGDAGTDVRSVLSWSYEQLSEPAARLFRLLGLHPGPDVSVSAAASLAGIPRTEVRPLLAELVRAHLVTERVSGRYALHDLLRAYAGELAESGESEVDRQAAVRRLLDHYLRSAHRAGAILDPARDPIELIAPLPDVTVDDVASADAAADWFTVENQALIAAVRLAGDAGLDRHAWQLVWSMAPFVDGRDFRCAVALHQIGVQAAQHLRDPAAQGYSHSRLGRVYAMLGEHDEARAHLEQALGVYRQFDDDTNLARVHLALGNVLDRQGRHRDALRQAEQALARLQTSGHRPGQAHALNAIGWCSVQLGDYETALEFCQQALDLQRELGNRQGEAAAWDSLGFAYHHLSRHPEAIAAYRQSITLCRDLGYRYNEADALVHLGDSYQVSGDTDAARHCWREALTIFSDLDHPDAEQVRARLRNSDDGGFDARGVSSSTGP